MAIFLTLIFLGTALYFWCQICCCFLLGGGLSGGAGNSEELVILFEKCAARFLVVLEEQGSHIAECETGCVFCY